MAELAYRFEGSEKLAKALSDPDIVAGPVKDFLHKSALTVERRAKEKAPVDTGRLRASITSEYQRLSTTIGPSVTYGAFVEYGTRPHWPPLAALQPWARRHGFPSGARGAFLVALAISRRGTRAQPYMGPALEESKGDIDALLTEMKTGIETRWHKDVS